MRRVLERVVVGGPVTFFHHSDLFADGDHRGDEAVDFEQGFALRRLDHECSRNREAQGWRMKAVVHQPLGNVLGTDALGATTRLLEWAQIQNALMRYMPVGAGVKRGVVVFQAHADVVGAQDRGFGRRLQAIRAHHAAIHPADRQDGGVTQGSCGNGADTVHRYASGNVSRQIRHQIGYHADRADARSTTTVRNAKGLVQVQVADVAAEFTGSRHADQRVHVGAVHIDAAPVLVHQSAQLLDLGFEHAVGAGVGDHHGGEIGAMLFALGAQVLHVNVAIGIARRHHHGEAGHLRTRRIGAVGA